jgi:hypothetical protein
VNALTQINAVAGRAAIVFNNGERASLRSRGVCRELVRKREDFPTVWANVLKGHALVTGLPESKLESRRPVLEIKLITGERLMFDREGKWDRQPEGHEGGPGAGGLHLPICRTGQV